MPRFMTHGDVATIVSMEMAIDALQQGFDLEGQGLAERPHRFDIENGMGWLRLMPVVVPGLSAFGFKAMNLTQGVGVRYAIWIYDLETGALRGILDAQLVTQLRTAATTAVATRLMARTDVERIAVIGTGAEARTHVRAMDLVRPTGKVMVFSRSPENRATFIAEMQSSVSCQLVDCKSVEEAVEGAGVVVLATKSSQPVFTASMIDAGMHINSIGSARHDQFELGEGVLAAADTIVCDSAEHVFSEAGDAVAAVDRGEVDPAGAHNLGDLVHGSVSGRQSTDDVTIFKSVGTAIQDLALGTVILDHAQERGVGTAIEDFPQLKAF